MENGEIIKRATQRFNLNVKTPRCPLCHDWMVRTFEKQRGLFIFLCELDEIAIRVDDPFVGQWDKALHNATGRLGIPCPRPSCEAKMRYFATQVGFMKAKCPKCMATLSSKESGRPKDKVTYTPDKPGAAQ